MPLVSVAETVALREASKMSMASWVQPLEEVCQQDTSEHTLRRLGRRGGGDEEAGRTLRTV
jgi:hypothetical protein